MNNEQVTAGSSSVGFYSWGSLCSAVLWHPVGEKPESGWPGVVMCHGFRGIKEWFLPPIAEEFANRGIAVLTFDYRGFGESEGVRGQLIPHEQAEDIRNAITYLSSQTDIDVNADRIGLWGTSFGCSVVIEVTAKDPHVKVVVGQVGPASIPRILEARPAESLSQLQKVLQADAQARVLTGKGGTIDPAKLMESKESDEAFLVAEKKWSRIKVNLPLNAVTRLTEYIPEKYVASISPRPVLLIGARKDTTVPASEMERFYELAGEPKRLEILDTTHYGVYEGLAADRAIELAGDWFVKYL